MKAILKFDLPEEKEEYEMFMQASRMCSALHSIKHYVRKYWKYHTFENEETTKIVDDIYNHICNETGELDL